MIHITPSPLPRAAPCRGGVSRRRMSVRRHFLALALAFLAACSDRAGSRPEPGRASSTLEEVYVCPDGQRFSAVFAEDGQSAILHTRNGRIRLARVPSMSGDLFSDQGIYLGRDGDEAFVAEGEVVIHEDCRAEGH